MAENMKSIIAGDIFIGRCYLLRTILKTRTTIGKKNSQMEMIISHQDVCANKIRVEIPRYQPLDGTMAYSFDAFHGENPICLLTPPMFLPYGRSTFNCRLLPPWYDEETRTFIRAIQAIDEGIRQLLRPNQSFRSKLIKHCNYLEQVAEGRYVPCLSPISLKTTMNLVQSKECALFDYHGTQVSHCRFNIEVRMLIRLSHIWVHSAPKDPRRVSAIGCIYEIKQIRELSPRCPKSIVCLIPGRVVDRGTQTTDAQTTDAQTRTTNLQTNPQHRRRPRGGIPLITASALQSLKLRKRSKRSKRKKRTTQKKPANKKPNERFQMVTVELLKGIKLRRRKSRPRKVFVPGKPKIRFPSFKDLRRKRIIQRACPPRPYTADDLRFFFMRQRQRQGQRKRSPNVTRSI